jgi:hypothetical protein
MTDAELIRYLRERDGVSAGRDVGHRRRGQCRYSRLYPGGEDTCPWCDAERAREGLAGEAAA